ncbi:FHA domain-containing protein [Streptomyces sp. CoH27]|uniref:FHA domain-containing protein n=1 Tax=Streptomyces sp. CoH27 TaxID=2875763 RepID=UPI001CD737AD|nr:FHA domain-containing protein [Streptomyces sp. CoH27]
MTEVRDWGDDEEWEGVEEGGAERPGESGEREGWEGVDEGEAGERLGESEGPALDRDWDEIETGVRPPPEPPQPPVAPPSAGRRCQGCRAVVPDGMRACPVCRTPVAAPGRRPERLAGGVLRLVFRGGRHLDVPRGRELRLGRSGTWATEASALLADEETVSARHATVVHTADGAAWVSEVAQGATNGTRVNDRVLGPDGSARLRNGDRVELGPRICFVVHGVEQEPEPEP